MKNIILDNPIKYKKLEVVTYVSFLSIAAFPLMKENISSISIIICSIFFCINYFISEKKPFLFKKLFILTIVFWMFFFRELFTLDFSTKRILLHLPFLIFPILFYYKPNYIDLKSSKIALKVFQLSVIIASFYYLEVFFQNNGLRSLFDISKENIPFFRDYIARNSSLDIHPTYFSVFLLISFNLSAYLVFFCKVNKVYLIIHSINIGIVTFMLFLFSSRMVIIIYFLTILFLIFLIFKSLKKNKKIIFLFLALIFTIVCLIPFQNLISQRFTEIVTEYNRPVEGNHHNSTNIRMAILSCSVQLIKSLPSAGYGNKLQKELNKCYEDKYNSNFSKISTYNTHNYYLNVLLYGGIFFLILFFIYLYVIYKNIKYSKLALIIFFQILVICLTENFLSRHYGIITFTYFIGIFSFRHKDQIKNDYKSLQQNSK